MGFIVDSKTLAIVNPLVLKRKNELKSIQKLKLHGNNYLYAKKYLMFLDIEPDDILGIINPNEYFIPHIRQLSLILLEYSEFKKSSQANILSTAKVYNFDCIKNHKKLIDSFIEIYQTYEAPLLVAHNGHNFDFIILESYIQRYASKEHTTINFSKFDTFIEIYKHKQRGNTIPSMSNSDLFKFYINSTDPLLLDTHTAEADTKMLIRWYKCYTLYSFSSDIVFA